MERIFQNWFKKKPGTIHNTSKDARTRLGLTALESREVPATVVDGVLMIDGTAGHDSVTVYSLWVGRNSSTGVELYPAIGVLQGGITQLIDLSLITQNQVEFRAYTGDDLFDNKSLELSAFADGGDGNDTLFGGRFNDTLIGGTGNDTLAGRQGDDTSSGMEGNDFLFEFGFGDLALGSGNDKLDGGSGDDTITAGDGSDFVDGGQGADRIDGGRGDDELNGGDGDDYLNGGFGVDVLSGGKGRDGLFAGLGDTGDTVTGGAGQDRFLDWTTGTTRGESRTDVIAEDAVVYFRDASVQTVILPGITGAVTFSAGAWSEGEIESVDNTLTLLQVETNNTRLLKTPDGRSLTFHRVGSPNHPAVSTIGGWNASNGSITLTQHALSSEALTKQATVHQIGHGWTTANPRFEEWLSLSGWLRHQPIFDVLSPPGKVRSGDGQWWYDETARFASEAGKLNPMEDFATTWTAHFRLGGAPVTAKLTHVRAFFDWVEALG